MRSKTLGAALPSANLFSSSVLPMALAAEHICLRTSSRRRMQRMMLPAGGTAVGLSVLVERQVEVELDRVRQGSLDHKEMRG